MQNWFTFSSQALSIELKYPNPTPQGFLVQIHERSGASSYRVHLVSDGSDEVYFEVGRYLDLPLSQAIAAFQQLLLEGINQFEIGEVEEADQGRFPGYQFSIRWPGKERIIQFIERGPALYRIIYDPASPVNSRMLKTIAFLEGT